MHHRAAKAILGCATSAMGGSVFGCPHCSNRHYRYHSCNHRSCPNCGLRDAEHWAKRQRARLLPVSHRMITFTVPQRLRHVFRSNQKLCFDLFFRACTETLQKVGAEVLVGKSHADAGQTRLGFIGVLHTWTRQLEYHPHIHFLVAEGALSDVGWHRPIRETFFLPVKKLSIDLRIRMDQMLRQQASELHAQIPADVWREEWVCHIGQAGSGHHAIDYLSRYVAQTAISRNRVLADQGGQITVAYTESSSGKAKTMKLNGNEFIRRVLQHVLPKGLKRIRAFGFYSPAAKKAYLKICALIAHWPSDPPEKPACIAPECPDCKLEMNLLGRLARAPPIPKQKQSNRRPLTR